MGREQGQSSQNGDGYLFKFLLVGDAGAGKTSILQRATRGCFEESYTSTLGLDFRVKILEVDGQTVRLQIWDTAGQERFRSLTRTYFRGASGVLLVYDLTSRESFEHVAGWLNDVVEHAEPDAALAVVGNKSDLEEARAVWPEDLTGLPEHAVVADVSARLGHNIDATLRRLAELAVRRAQQTPEKKTEQRLKLLQDGVRASSRMMKSLCNRL